jgi:predicted O-methyltransferase YrrM
MDSWEKVDRYFEASLVPGDPALDEAIAANQSEGLPAHDVSRMQGKLLQLLATMGRARHVLEIGTLGGYSTIWLARALPPDGRVVTLELNPRHAERARANLRRAGLEARVEVRVGPALDSLRDEGAGPFDFIFIDADKPNNPAYLGWALALSRPGTVIVGDNVVRDGAVADSRSDDPNVIGVRGFLEEMGRNPRLSATAIQTVGAKGYDGFALALVLPP